MSNKNYRRITEWHDSPSGFLCSKPADADSPHLFSTDKNGFKTHIKKSKLAGSSYYWTNKKYIVSWDSFVYINGRRRDVYSTMLRYGYIITVARTASIVVIVACDGEGYADSTRIFFLNTACTMILGESAAIQGVQYFTKNTASINHDCTKLVFIGSSLSQQNQAPPFDIALNGGENNPVGLMGGLAGYSYPGASYAGLGFCTNNSGGYFYNKWESVYEVTLDCINYTATVASKIDQYSLHVYKVTDTKLQNTDGEGSYTGSTIVTAVNKEPYITEVWFDLNGVRQTERNESSFDLNCTYSETRTRAGYGAAGTWNDRVYTGSSVGEIRSKAFSVLGNLEEYSTITGTGTYHKHFWISSDIVYGPNGNGYLRTYETTSATANEASTLSSVAGVEGVNQYIPNAQIVNKVRNPWYVNNDYLWYQNQGLNSPEVKYTVTCSVQSNGLNVFNVTYPNPTPPFSYTDTDGFQVTGNGVAVFHFATTAERTDEGSPSWGIDQLPNPNDPVAPRNVQAISETFVIVHPLSVFGLGVYSNIKAMTDRYGNMLYVAHWDTQSQLIEGVKGYDASGVPIPVGIASDIASVAQYPYNGVNVV